MRGHHILGHASVLLLLLHLMGAFALATSIHATLVTALVHGLAQLVHSVGVCAIVRVWTGLSNIEVLAHDGLVVFELLAISAIALTRVLMVTATAAASLIASTTASAASTSTLVALEAIIAALVAIVHLAAHLASATALRVHATATSTAHLIVVSLAAAGSTGIRVVALATTVASSALVPTTGVVGVSATSAVATAALVATAMRNIALVSALVRSSHVLMTARVTARTAHSSSLAWGLSATGLSAHILRDGVVHLSQFGIAVSVLTILAPLAEALVLEVSALLRLVALIDLTEVATVSTARLL